MAWELPHKPFYIEQELQDAYKNGDFLLIDRSDTIVDDPKSTTTKKPVTKTAPIQRIDYNQPDRYYTKDRYYAKDGSDKYYNYQWPTKSNKFDYYFTNDLMNGLNSLTKMKYNGKDESWRNNWRRKEMNVNR